MAGFQNDPGVTQQEAGFGYDGRFFTVSQSDNLTAKVGGGQSGATQLPSMVNRVTTVASAGDSVGLPPSRPTLLGVEILVINAGANSMNVFGSGNDTINFGTAAAAVSQMANSAVYYTLLAFNPTTNVGTWIANGIGMGFAGQYGTFSTQGPITATPSGTQGNSILISALQVLISTVASAGDGVLLPPAKPGMEITVLNNAAANACNVFPASVGQGGVSGGDKINALAQNAAFSLVVSTTAPTIFYCFVAGIWQTK